MERYREDLRKIKENLRGVRDDEILMKARILIRVLESDEAIRLSCDRLGITAKTFYAWLSRARAANFNLQFVKNKPRRPHSSPLRTPRDVEERLCEIRQKTGHSGGQIVSFVYYQETGKKISHSAADKIFARLKLTAKRRVCKSQHTLRYSSKKPLERVQFDTLWLGIEDENGNRVYTTDAIDCCTRFAFVRLCDSKDSDAAKETLQEFLAKVGKPALVQTDNGVEFTARYTSELNSKRMKPAKMAAFEAVLFDLGIPHYLIKPRTPQHNGKVERFHRTLLRWVHAMDLHGRPFHEINNAIQTFVHWYNHKRPHSALNYLPPAAAFYPVDPAA